MAIEQFKLFASLVSSQVNLDASILSEANKSANAFCTNSLVIPLCFAAVSALFLLLHLIGNSQPFRKLFRQPVISLEEFTAQVQPDNIVQELNAHIRSSGGPVIYVYMLARLIGSLALLGLSVTTLILDEVRRTGGQSLEPIGEEEGDADALGKWGKRHPKKKYGTHYTKREWLEAAMCLTFLYTSLLALISVTAKHKWSRVIIRHLNTTLLAALCVYLYRDVYPLITFTLKPKDISEGGILWAKVAVLAITSVVIPLAIPRPYVPVDPTNPLSKSSPEQTASIFSLVTYAFIDRMVLAAYRVSHLEFDQLPPLGDYDSAEYLKSLSFKHLDVFSGAPKRHLFFGLMKIFRRAYAQLSVMILLHVCANFAAPIGLNRLLRYLEPGGEEAVVRPWFWILWLFIGPVGGTLSIQWYVFVTTRTLVRTQAIITQLVFEHSLRIRVKPETADSGASSTTSSSPETLTPDSVSVHEGIVDGSDTIHSVSPSESVESSTVHSSSASVSSGKSKDKKKKDKDSDTPTSDTNNLVGKINNLVTTDLENILDGRDFLFVLIYIPVQIVLCMVFLYAVLGWSCFVGLGVLIISFPLPGIIAKYVQQAQEKRLKKTDARVQSVSESMNVLRMIKLFGWESKMESRIAKKRDEELIWIRRRQILEIINGIITGTTSHSHLTKPRDSSHNNDSDFRDISVVMKQTIRASVIFSSMSVFDMLREQMRIIFRSVNDTMTAKVSLDRVSDFLKNTELLDLFSGNSPENNDYFVPADTVSDLQEIGFRNAIFAWSSNVGGSLTPSKRRFMLRIDGELLFKRNCVNLIIGETGSGKTSLLMALLSEMHFIPSGPNSWYNLPREGGIAYAAQESWVQNETIRENIIFGSPFEPVRYNKVLYQCGLERDISLFEAGDATEVGEKGLTLSGGQKARITLARAIYSRAEILLLDDVLAALDVHTARWIVDNCFAGDLMENRTIILVTHNIAVTRPIAGFVVAIKDGRIASQGTVVEALGRDFALAEEARREQQMIDKTEGEVDKQIPTEEGKRDGKLIVAEEIQEGHVSWSAVKMYLTSMGGQYSWTFFLAFLFAIFITEILNAFYTWFLGYWASQYEYENRDPASVSVFYYIGIYCLIMATAVSFYTTGVLIYVFGTIRASRTIHKELITAIFGTTLRWLDTTPTSRVIARCTQDIRAVDGPVAMWLQMVSEISIMMILKYTAVVVITPIFFCPGVIVAFLGALCGQVYIKAQLSVKREMSNARAPVLGHFGAAIAGLTSIRAYGVQEAFKAESLRRIDKFTRAARTFYNLNRWITIRVDVLGALLSCVLAAYLVYHRGQSASNTGFSLNMAVGFSSLILWWVRTLNEFEVQGNSLERIQDYISIEQEPKPTSKAVLPAYWPASGNLRAEKLSARYSLDGPKVLHDISFDIQSGERVGIVGRTGSGKSSLTLSLLRCIFTEGTVYYDGVPTDEIDHDALRSNITIIPQVPELLSGTLRQNLDPFDQYDDATLNDALRAAGLFALQSEMNEGQITLDSSISSGGGNLSVGQRQILALARALVRGSKVLILDEATSAIGRTDSIIQDSLRNELKGDITLITVAHRLQTIMDADRIMVLDAGRIVEFDSPKALLKVKDGKLRSLVEQSNDRDILYAMVDKATRSS
ncbi:hypothetical protein J3R30DRAFT_3759412 [Lentinula aciculospora]|uniref:P-loop containing nucleoside triphosphate hydrolase protein n=1 Tax=Lentinula aciculospora TaxID=153920 RepID=A0A9W9A966_9AGAR|nr:hypothetical protein J3R30DRAFT_3759412 [Lentinula aciculospora]